MSVAVYVTTYSPSVAVSTIPSVVTSTSPLTSSFAVTSGKVKLLSFNLIYAVSVGTPDITGALPSTTTVNVALAVFPALSVAVYVTV